VPPPYHTIPIQICHAPTASMGHCHTTRATPSEAWYSYGKAAWHNNWQAQQERRELDHAHNNSGIYTNSVMCDYSTMSIVQLWDNGLMLRLVHTWAMLALRHDDTLAVPMCYTGCVCQAILCLRRWYHDGLEWISRITATLLVASLRFACFSSENAKVPKRHFEPMNIGLL